MKTTPTRGNEGSALPQRSSPRPVDSRIEAFWSLAAADLLALLRTTDEGLSAPEAAARLALGDSSRIRAKSRFGALGLFLAQINSPLVLTLVVAACLSYFLHDSTDALIILGIILVSALLGFYQEYGAASAVEKLLAFVKTNATLLRDGQKVEVPTEEVVPGDIVLLSAGAAIPGDCLLLDSKDLYVDEAALTGETYPVEKEVGPLGKDAPLNQRSNSLFMGAHVVSGAAKAVVVHTGKETEFGKISERLKFRPPDTEFERGVRRFGYFLLEVTLLLVIAIFAINVYLERPVVEAFLFALALAVGLTPQLLPAIITINLSHGASQMARRKVIVKRLASIENFGSMNILCSDKTGTLPEGIVHVRSAEDVQGRASDRVLLYACLNASFETGFANPIDTALRAHGRFDLTGHAKLDEVPYDFIRKRISVLVSKDGATQMVTKGAVHETLAVCSWVEMEEGKIDSIEAARESIAKRYEDLSARGLRTLAVACRDMKSASLLSKEDEREMVFLGFVSFFDPPKAGVRGVIENLRRQGIALKIITGDNELVARSLSQEIGLTDAQVITGPALRQMSDEALVPCAQRCDIFAEVEPNQKERIVVALKKAGNVVGYMGDGINDASALHAADVGISVEDAVDVAKEAADIVLLEKDLAVLMDGVREGRVTFANTLKYVLMATSANFGNMFSMAGASLFLPFLPLLPKQILLTNLLTDFPEMSIASDGVDEELITQPRRWNIQFIRKFMLVFGILSSVFDFLTFGALLLILHAGPELFRSGWFVESVVSATAVALVIRTRRPLFKSRPGRLLATAILAVICVAGVFPFTPVGRLFGFVALPPFFMAFMGTIVVAYIVMTEVVKRYFYRRFVG